VCVLGGGGVVEEGGGGDGGRRNTSALMQRAIMPLRHSLLASSGDTAKYCVGLLPTASG
jgi:hypothetical protein